MFNWKRIEGDRNAATAVHLTLAPDNLRFKHVSESALDIQPLEKAVASLAAALTRHAQSPDDDIVRDACIQRFEFTYELSHKMLKRFLEATSANPAQFDRMSFQDLIRTGSERGILLSDWSRWKLYRTARSLTSNTYDEKKARDAFALIPGFLTEACQLRDHLRTALA